MEVMRDLYQNNYVWNEETIYVTFMSASSNTCILTFYSRKSYTKDITYVPGDSHKKQPWI
jgi:hypothetical protein